jgi:hypothetical protein
MAYRIAWRASAALGLAAVLLWFSGCSGGPSASGTVSFNGASVDNGTIIFSPEGNTKEKASAKIVDGKFTIPSQTGLSTGKNRVEIYWNQKTGKQVGTPGDTTLMMDETVQVIPNQFNTGSTLTEEVKSGSNTFTFDLKGTANTPGQGTKLRPGESRSKD